MRTGTAVASEKTYGTFRFTIEDADSWPYTATLTVTNKRVIVAWKNTILEKPLNQISGVRVTRSDGFLGLGFWATHKLWISGIGQLESGSYEDITAAADLITSLTSH